MGGVCADLADFGIFTDEDPRGEDPCAIVEQIAAGAAARGWRAGADYELLPDRPTALARAVALARPGDAVLLAGKGHENTIVYDGWSLPWDEATEARAALQSVAREALYPHGCLGTLAEWSWLDGRRTDALDEIARAIAAAPLHRRGRLRTRRAEWLVAAGDVAGARSELMLAIAEDPGYLRSQEVLASLPDTLPP